MSIIFGLGLILLPVVIGGIIVIGSAIWVYKDAKRYEEAGVNIMSRGKWSILCLLFWFPFFFIYLILKSQKYKKQLIDPTFQPNKSTTILIVVIIFILGIGGIILSEWESWKAKTETEKVISEKILEEKKPPAVEEAYIEIFNYNIYYWNQTPRINKTLKVTGATKEERWQQVKAELEKVALVRGYGDTKKFPEQNENQLDLDYQWVSDTEYPFFYIYWTDPATKIRYQVDSGGIIKQVKK